MNVHVVSYKTITRDNYTEYELVGTESGCADFIYSVREIFGFGEVDYKPLPKFSIKKEEGPYGESWTNERGIDYCPFCGAIIVYNEIEKQKFVKKETTKTVVDTKWVLVKDE